MTKLADTLYNSDGTVVGPNAGNAITALTTDVVATGPGSVAATIQANAVTTSKINNAAVTYAKIQNVSANSKLLGSSGSGSGAPPSELSIGSGLDLSASTLSVISNVRLGAIQATVNGGGSAPTTGIFADVYIPYACTITAATMLADQSGSAVIDVWITNAYSSTPTVANTITASALPTLSSAENSQDTTLTGWTTSITAGSRARFKLNSITTCTWVQLTLTVTR